MKNNVSYKTSAQNLFACLIAICFSFISINTLYAQFPCAYTYGGGCTTTIASSISTTVSLGAGNHCVSSDIVISSGGVLIINGGNIPVTGNYSITVQDNGQLIFINSHAFGVSSMWKGIKGEPGSFISVSGSSVKYADIAIEITGTSTTSSLSVSNCCFEDNDVGIFLNAASPGSVDHLIEDSEFKSPALITPKSGEVGDYGILCLGSNTVDPGPYWEIGNTDIYTGSSTYNYFHDLAIAIRGFESNMKIQNCKVENTLSTDAADMPTGTPVDELADYDEGNVGILSTSENLSPNYERYMQVGTSVLDLGDYNNYIGNTITQGFLGIVAQTQVSTEIYSNLITGGFSGSLYFMKDGIRLRYPYSDHSIENNLIQNFRQHGILLYDISTGVVTINENIIECTEPEDDLGLYGIRAVLSPNAMDFTANTISNVITGILVNGSNDMNISANEIEFVNPDPSTVTAYGIAVLNGDDAFIATNLVAGNCTSGGCNLNTRGFM